MLRKNKLRYFVIAAGCFIANITVAFSQESILDELHKIQDSYKKPAYLSYDLSYSISPVDKPDSTIYSGKGSYKINEANYWGIMDSVEYMQNAEYSIAVVNQKKLIHISTPTSLFSQIISLPSFDSLISKNKIKYSVTSLGKNKQIYFDFSNTPGFEYKDFKIVYEASSHYFKGISYTTLDQVSNDSDDQTLRLISFKAIFDNYKTDPFDTIIFNPNKYFSVLANQYVPQKPYEDYEIFIASPELIKK